MVYAEEHSSPLSAIAREQQLKRWTRKKKEAVIVGDRAALKSLSRSSSSRRPAKRHDPTLLITP